MTPVHFAEENCTLTGTGEVGNLPVYRADGMIVSCWRPSWRERLSVLFHGRVWLYVVQPNTHPPVVLKARREI